MRIRTATQDDLDALCRVEAICFPASEAGTRESFAARLKVFSRHFRRLEDEGRLIGVVNGMVTDDRTISDVMFEKAELHKEGGKWQSVFGLDVLPEYRRNGYAGQLMRAFIDHAREDGRCGCILTCKEYLLHYYARFGFKNLGVSLSKHGGAVWYDMVLEFSSPSL